MNSHYLTDVSKVLHRRSALPPVHLEGPQLDAMYIMDWLDLGWRSVRRQPLLWLAAMFVCATFATACKFVPIVRPLIVLVAPFVVGALMVAQERVRIGRPASAGDICAALGRHHNALLSIGLASAAIVVVGYVLLVAALNVSSVESMLTNGTHHVSITYGGTGVRGIVATLVAVPIFTIALASAWFAPALVVLRNVAPLEAMAASLHGAARNWKTTLIYVVAVADAVLLAHRIPLFASALVLTPLMLMSIYGGYRDLFASRSV